MALCLQQGFRMLFLNKSVTEDCGNRSVSINQQKCTMTEHAAEMFSDVRRVLGVDEHRYALALGGSSHTSHDFKSTSMRYIGTPKASGKSSAWFLVTSDMHYLLKTCSAKESDLLVELLPGYLSVVSSRLTLLPRFCGLYTLSFPGWNIRFFVVVNVFAASIPIQKRYDLKGSTHGRRALEMSNSPVTFKDVDLLSHGRRLEIESLEERGLMFRALVADVRWLEEHHLIDYSLLVGLAEGDVPSSLSPQKLVGSPNLAYIGLVDILTQYTWRKACEHAAFRWMGDISCQPPSRYASRFLRFMAFVFPSRHHSGENLLAQWLAIKGSGGCFSGVLPSSVPVHRWPCGNRWPCGTGRSHGTLASSRHPLPFLVT